VTLELLWIPFSVLIVALCSSRLLRSVVLKKVYAHVVCVFDSMKSDRG
jgi:hypothetical protein